MKLGVKRGTVNIVEYSENWQIAFEKEKTFLLKIFKENHLDIQHIGSTAIPNLPAKPLIDIAVKVSDIDNLGNIPILLIKNNYEKRVGRLKGRQKVFAKGGNQNVTHHLHIIEAGEPGWEAKIKFRNKLLQYPELVDEYAALKKILLKKYRDNRSEYTRNKTEFIQKVLKHE